MQAKISLRQRVALIVTAVTDILMLVAAMILDSLRESLPTEYILAENGDITAVHPLDRFGIAVALALVIVTVMFAFALVNIINSEDKHRRGKAIGFSLLFALSVTVVMFSYLWVRGSLPQRTVCHNLTDSNVDLVLMEEIHSDDFGTLNIFLTDQHREEIVLLAATNINSYSKSSDDYYIDWIMDNVLRIRFPDGNGYRSIQIDLNTVLTEAQQQYFLNNDSGTGTHDHDHDHG